MVKSPWGVQTPHSPVHIGWAGDGLIRSSCSAHRLELTLKERIKMVATKKSETGMKATPFQGRMLVAGTQKALESAAHAWLLAAGGEHGELFCMQAHYQTKSAARLAADFATSNGKNSHHAYTEFREALDELGETLDLARGRDFSPEEGKLAIRLTTGAMVQFWANFPEI